jgi:Bifunctional DNA primase/polymerase, N-terminal/Primase C terminal 1 (PriCT-1)
MSEQNSEPCTRNDVCNLEWTVASVPEPPVGSVDLPGIKNPNNPILTMALAHARKGRPVLPLHWPLAGGGCSCENPKCDKVGKHPLTRHGLTDASTDPEIIRGWFAQSPNANLGMRTGSVSGVVVLDVDGVTGAGSLKNLTDQFGPLPSTSQSKTRRGKHYFLQCPQGIEIKNSVGKLGPGLDVRADGGYIVIPPSKFLGGRYEWVNKEALAAIPDWLLSKLISPVARCSSGTPPTDRIAQGQRNQKLASLAGSMQKRNMTLEAIELALLAENRNRCDPPLPDTEVWAIARSIGRYEPDHVAQSSNEVDDTVEPGNSERAALPSFPDAAWRGLFSHYRDAMRACSEASDVFHFLAFWTAAGNALGRRVFFPYGMRLYPNVYGIAFGPTGDFKTSALKRAAESTESAGLRVVRGVGSGEGITEDLGPDPTLFSLDEFTSLLRQGKWNGSTLLPTLTEIFDCLDKYERKYRKNPISLNFPTCSILACTTQAWFWRDVTESDFEGGFGNRFIYLTGPPNEPKSRPGIPDLRFVVTKLEELKAFPEQEAFLDPKAEKMWDRFYLPWRKKQFSPLEGAATKRIPAYVLKLAMVYAALEGTLPEIQDEQLKAALLVGNYAVKCAQQLIGERFSGANAFRELEKKILAKVAGAPNHVITKRNLLRSLARHYQNAEQFNRVFESMVRAGNLFTQPLGHGRVNVSTEPLD